MKKCEATVGCKNPGRHAIQSGWDPKGGPSGRGGRVYVLACKACFNEFCKANAPVKVGQIIRLGD